MSNKSAISAHSVFGALMRVRMRALWQTSFGKMNRRGKSKGPVMKILIGLLALYVIGCLILTVSALCFTMGSVLIAQKMEWLYFSILALLALMLSFVGSVFTAYTQLYEAKDNELLLSMPIPTGYILISRITMIVCLNLIFTFLFMLPALAVWTILGQLTISSILTVLVGGCCIALLGTAISCLLGWLIGLIISRLPGKNTVMTVCYLLFFFGYMGLYFYLTSQMETILSKGVELGKAVASYLPPVYSFGMAASGNWLHLLLTLLWGIVPILLIYMLLRKDFSRIAAGSNHHNKVRAKKQQGALKRHTPLAAITQKELKRIVTLPVYFLNCALGAVMTLIVAGIAVIKGPGLMAALAQENLSNDIVPLVLAGVLAFCSIMCNSSCASLSLEGKGFSTLKTFPLPEKVILNAKILANLILGIPPLFVSVVVSAFALQLNILDAIFVLLVAVGVQVFAAMFGMICNLIFPRFDWISETAVVKQSGSVMASVFGSMGVLVIPAIGCAILSVLVSPVAGMVAAFGFFLALDIALFFILRQWGPKRLRSIC